MSRLAGMQSVGINSGYQYQTSLKPRFADTDNCLVSLPSRTERFCSYIRLRGKCFKLGFVEPPFAYSPKLQQLKQFEPVNLFYFVEKLQLHFYNYLRTSYAASINIVLVMPARVCVRLCVSSHKVSKTTGRKLMKLGRNVSHREREKLSLIHI